MINKILNYQQRLSKFIKEFQYQDLLRKIIIFAVKFWRRTAVVVVVIILLYYPLGAFFIHKIAHNLELEPQKVTPKALNSIAITADLINREVNQNLWTANLPFFFPAVILDNMPSYQMGIISSLTNFLKAMVGCETNNKELNQAYEFLKYPPDLWIIDFSKSWLPMTSTNKKYRHALRELQFYNAGLTEGKNSFEPQKHYLQIITLIMAEDLNQAAEITRKQVYRGSKRIIDLKADNLFYYNKGKLYGYYMILKELTKDFAQIIKEQNRADNWEEMLITIKSASLLEPFWVINGKPDAGFMPSHLAGQGFYLMLAQEKLKQITD